MGSRGPNTERKLTERSFLYVPRLAAAGKPNPSDSVSAQLPLDEVNEGLRILQAKEGDPVRIVIRP